MRAVILKLIHMNEVKVYVFTEGEHSDKTNTMVFATSREQALKLYADKNGREFSNHPSCDLQEYSIKEGEVWNI